MAGSCCQFQVSFAVEQGLLDTCLCALLFGGLGYGLAFGGTLEKNNLFFGTTGFAFGGDMFVDPKTKTYRGR